MSSGGCTRIGETSRVFRTSTSTLVGSWLTKTGCAVTWRSGFSGSTAIVRPFPDFMRRLGLLTQRMWLSAFRISCSMSLPRKKGVIRNRRKNCGGMWRGTSNVKRTCAFLRGGYCWVVVGHAGFQYTTDHWQHQKQSR